MAMLSKEEFAERSIAAFKRFFLTPSILK